MYGFFHGMSAAVPAWMMFGAVPASAIAVALPALAIAFALFAHAGLRALLRRLCGRHVLLTELIDRTSAIGRYALVLLALSAVIPWMALAPAAADIVHKVFVAAVVLLVGWAVLLAASISADYYMGHLRIDTANSLFARKAMTQVAVLKRIAQILIVMMTVGSALMTFDTVREFGVSLFASAGLAGLVGGLAARPIFANIFAGLQLAMTQPIRLHDQVLIENEFGQVEEFNSSYVVVRLWDLRRMVVPLSYFMEKPFQNWTRTSSRLLGSVYLYLDFSAPIPRLRQKAEEFVRASPLWDQKVLAVQVTDAKETVLQLRVLMSAANAADRFDLCCEVREKLIQFLQTELPDALPRVRSQTIAVRHASAALTDPSSQAAQ